MNLLVLVKMKSLTLLTAAEFFKSVSQIATAYRKSVILVALGQNIVFL